jgi:hypothetical protein
MKPRERYRIEIYSGVLNKWSYLFPFEGGLQYCQGACQMYDAHYSYKQATDPIRIIRLSDNKVVDSGWHRVPISSIEGT